MLAIHGPALPATVLCLALAVPAPAAPRLKNRLGHVLLVEPGAEVTTNSPEGRFLFGVFDPEDGERAPAVLIYGLTIAPGSAPMLNLGLRVPDDKANLRPWPCRWIYLPDGHDLEISDIRAARLTAAHAFHLREPFHELRPAMASLGILEYTREGREAAAGPGQAQGTPAGTVLECSILEPGPGAKAQWERQPDGSIVLKPKADPCAFRPVAPEAEDPVDGLPALPRLRGPEPESKASSAT